MRSLEDEKTLILGLSLVLGFIYLTVSKEVGGLLNALVGIYGSIVLFTKKPFQFIIETALTRWRS